MEILNTEYDFMDYYDNHMALLEAILTWECKEVPKSEDNKLGYVVTKEGKSSQQALEDRGLLTPSGLQGERYEQI